MSPPPPPPGAVVHSSPSVPPGTVEKEDVFAGVMTALIAVTVFSALFLVVWDYMRRRRRSPAVAPVAREETAVRAPYAGPRNLRV